MHYSMVGMVGRVNLNLPDLFIASPSSGTALFFKSRR